MSVDKLVDSFATLLENQYYTDNEADLSSLVTYFEGKWIGSLDRRGKCHPPQFLIEGWNYLDRLKDDLHNL